MRGIHREKIFEVIVSKKISEDAIRVIGFVMKSDQA